MNLLHAQNQLLNCHEYCTQETDECRQLQQVAQEVEDKLHSIEIGHFSGTLNGSAAIIRGAF